VNDATRDGQARAWSFLVAGQRDHQGNEGYDDIAEEAYSFDSTVSNHLRVRLGDLVLVRNNREALGISRVEKLDETPGVQKPRRRCPTPGCGRTSFKERTTKRPRFLCSDCGTAFDSPVVEQITVTAYVAHYGGCWQALEGCLAGEQLEALCMGRSKQQSVRELWPDRTLEAVERRGIRLPAQLPPPARRRHHDELPGGRRRREAAVRNGQDAFRKALVREYGMTCAVTGPAPAEVLQAAHLRPFAVHERHRVDEGLLLRSDIHSLFDGHLLAISPELEVHVSPGLAGYRRYAGLHGSPLRIPETAPLNRTVLEDLYEKVTATW
jgi:hypothetical protein